MSVDTLMLAKEYMKSGKTHMMQIATVSDNKPWICTVYFAVDEQLNLYWASKNSRRHSQELALNARAAVAISHDQQPPIETHQGIQAEGTVLKLAGQEKNQALDIYADQLKSDPQWIDDIKSGVDTHQIYKFTPTALVFFDDINYPDSPRQVAELS